MPTAVDATAGGRSAVGFVRLLRGAELTVPFDSTVVFASALARVGWADPNNVYWAARATLCRRPEDVERFDACFLAWFGERRRPTAAPTPPSEVVVALDVEAEEHGDDDVTDDGDEHRVLAVRFSRAEALRDRDFASFSAAEHREARRAIAELRVAGPKRRSRRQMPSRRRGRPDVGRTLRSSLRTGGEPFTRTFRAPTLRPRRLVVLCDVSGSMEPYSRVIVRFLQSAVISRRQVEAFAIGTRLTRITRELSNRDPDAAIAAAASRVNDWSGGTRLGEAISEFNTEWGIRGMARGAVVVIVSDGWDRGRPELLGEQMRRLHRVAHRVVWVNPLKASPGYAPLAAGMAAALPSVDDFVEGHSLASLAGLVAVIDR